jgi:hypothetical protein
MGDEPGRVRRGRWLEVEFVKFGGHPPCRRGALSPTAATMAVWVQAEEEGSSCEWSGSVPDR